MYTYREVLSPKLLLGIGASETIPKDLDMPCTVSFHNFKSQDFRLSVSNPKSKYVVYFVPSVSNFKLPGYRPQKQT